MADAGNLPPFINQTGITRPPGGLAAHALDKNAAPPIESFSPGAQLDHVGPPRFEDPAQVSEGQRRGIGWGKGLVLALAGLAAGVAGTVAVIHTSSSSEVAETKPMTAAEQAALRNIDLMQQIAEQDGGGFKVENWFGRQVPAKDVRQVYNRVADGEAVWFYESEAEVPVRVNNFEELRDLARDVAHRHNMAELRRAADELGNAAREGLEELEGAAREGLEKLKDIFK